MGKKVLVFALTLFLVKYGVAQYDAQGINLLANWKDSSFNHNNMVARYNSIWGWYDEVKQKEYAIMGGKDGTYFIEVTNPSNPVLRAYVKGKVGDCTWREYKAFGNYAYLISDDTHPNIANTFQIVDMSYLPDSVHIIHDSPNILSRAHTLYIDSDKLYCAMVKAPANTYYNMAVYSLADPTNPTLISTLNDDYPTIQGIHDMFVRNDTIYASAQYQGLYIFKLTASNKFEMLGHIIGYPYAGYNHSSWLTPDGKTLVFLDEVPEGLPAKIADVSDLSDIRITSTFNSTEGPTPHNPYIVGQDKLIIAYYQDGIQIFDISDPYNPIRTSYFDTHPQNGNSYLPFYGYDGCWGAYPYLPSGIILAADRQNGLFILQEGEDVKTPKVKSEVVKIWPNPFQNHLTIKASDGIKDVMVSCHDISGRLIYLKNLNLHGNSCQISLGDDIPKGFYILNIKGQGINHTEKLLKQ
jgi:choice-of-anchor B domain-containing protein